MTTQNEDSIEITVSKTVQERSYEPFSLTMKTVRHGKFTIEQIMKFESVLEGMVDKIIDTRLGLREDPDDGLRVTE